MLAFIIEFGVNCNTERKERENYSIPDLELNEFVVDGDHPSPKLDTDGEVVDRLEPLVRELKKKT